MKTIRIIAFLFLMLSATPSFSQENGFFKRFPSEGKWLVPSCAIETDDGNFIVAINDDSFEGNGELAKLSSEGELLLTNPFNDPDHWSRAYNVFRHPQEQGTFIGLGTDIEPPFEFNHIYNGIPYFFHFDEELNLTFQTYPEWPEELRNYWLSPTSLLGKDRKVFCEYFLMNYEGGLNFRRIRTKMSLNGDFERFIEDTTDMTSNGLKAIFEFPGTKDIGIYRESQLLGDSFNSSYNTLFRVNQGLECEPINKLYRFGEDTIITSTYIDFRAIFLMATNSYSTIIPLDDSTLLFSTDADESLYRYAVDTNMFDLQHSAVMFKADTAGNIGQHCVIGSWNDTIEFIPNRSIDVTDPSNTGNRKIYHCCYSQNKTSYESPNTLTVTKFTEEFDILWRKRYSLYNTCLKACHLMATSDGGCLIVGTVTVDENHEWFALKLLPDGTVGTGEITVTDEIFFYPNPARDVLHLHYPQEMQPTQIELYDLQGRLVRTKTTGFESLSMEGLSAGQYVLKVTLENGKVYTDKVVKE